MAFAQGPALPAKLKGDFAAFTTPLPKSAEEWTGQRDRLRAKLRECLGEWPALFTPKPTLVSREKRRGYALEKFTFDNGVGDTVYGYLLVPTDAKGRGPAIMYQHYHGGQYRQGKEEARIKAFKTLDIVPAEELARLGYIVLCIDAYCFGERRFQGPAGEKEEGRATEEALFKTFLWQGRTLWGMIVRDDVLALNYLISRPEVDPKRIAALGMSMGSTRSWWLAAMDDRIKTTVSVACLTRYQNLIAHGEMRQHGIYYFVPGMLREKIDTESVIGLIAPRPHLTLTGDQDAGSPADGAETINEFQRGLYKLHDRESDFRGVIYKGVGHDYTPEMWKETLAWLKAKL